MNGREGGCVDGSEGGWVGRWMSVFFGRVSGGRDEWMDKWK